MRDQNDNFFGVIGDVANMAADEIGNYQKQKLDYRTAQQRLSVEQQAELRRMAIAQAQQEHSQRMDERQMGIAAEANRHNLAMEAKGAGPKTLQEAWLEATSRGDTARAKQIEALLMQSDQYTRTDRVPKVPTNFAALTATGMQSAKTKNAELRQKQATTTIVPGPNGTSTYAPPSTKELSDEDAFEQSWKAQEGMVAGSRDINDNPLRPDSVYAAARQASGLPMKAYNPGGLTPGDNTGRRVPLGGSYRDRINRFGGVPAQPSTDLKSLTNEQLIELWKQANADTTGN